MLVLEVFGPERYWSGWLWLGIILVIAAVVAPLIIMWWSRPRPKKLLEPRPDSLARHRHEALAQITAAQQQYHCGGMEARVAHQRFSEIVRGFIHNVTGQRVDTMTTSQLRDRLGGDARLGELANWEAALEPPKFAIDADRGVDRSADEARQLVTSWG